MCAAAAAAAMVRPAHLDQSVQVNLIAEIWGQSLLCDFEQILAFVRVSE